MKEQHLRPLFASRFKRHGGVAARVVLMLVAGTAIGLLIHFSPRLFFAPNRPIASRPQLKTGATSVIFVVTENVWRGKYAKEKGVEINCDSAGTTAGVTGMLEKKYTLAFTHAPVSAGLVKKAKKSGCEIVHTPMFLCGVVPAYHIKELKGMAPLKFSGTVLADIFLGKIKQWDGPALKAMNPDVKLPSKEITVVHREDSSGTTQLFTAYLAAVSPAWVEKVGPAAAEVKWPQGVAASRNQGVAAKIAVTDGAIGYVDRLYTSFQDIELDYGAIQNKDKSAFVRAEPANLTAAAVAIQAQIPEDMTFDLINKPGKDSYPISGVIYAVCSDRQPEATRKRVVDFLHWATHDGQADVAKTSFAPLPTDLAARADHHLEAIKSVQ